MAVGHLTIRRYKINIRPIIFQWFGEAADLIVGQMLCPPKKKVKHSGKGIAIACSTVLLFFFCSVKFSSEIGRKFQDEIMVLSLLLMLF